VIRYSLTKICILSVTGCERAEIAQPIYGAVIGRIGQEEVDRRGDTPRTAQAERPHGRKMAERDRERAKELLNEIDSKR